MNRNQFFALVEQRQISFKQLVELLNKYVDDGDARNLVSDWKYNPKQIRRSPSIQNQIVWHAVAKAEGWIND